MSDVSYLLIPIVACLLAAAQACWASFIKTTNPFSGSAPQIIGRFVTSPRFWFGAFLYALATVTYFLALSKYHFFVIQVTVTALAILFSVTFSRFLLHETLSALNILGVVIVIAGISLVLVK